MRPEIGLPADLWANAREARSVNGSRMQRKIGKPTSRLKSDARALLARFLSEASIAVVPFGESHYGAAVEAWLRFGKGRHPAALNFGDCLSYAVASLADEPLLFVGGTSPGPMSHAHLGPNAESPGQVAIRRPERIGQSCGWVESRGGAAAAKRRSEACFQPSGALNGFSTSTCP
jgi:uncharacterized protein with PIN domain